MQIVSKRMKISAQFLLLAVFLFVIFATGGSSRIDEAQLAILRPASLVFGMLAILMLSRKHLAEYRYLLAWCSTIFVLSLAHLVPLPPTIWRLLPGSEDVLSIESAASVELGWRQLTMAPTNAWQALASLITPLTVILLGIQLGKDDRYRLLILLIGLAALSGLIGLIQSLGNPSSPLYFYNITNDGLAVGLFANRNHAATLLASLFPMLAVYSSIRSDSVSHQRIRQFWCAAIAVVLVPLILVTGSRSGLLSAVIGLGGAALLYRGMVSEKPKKHQSLKNGFGNAQIAGGLIVLCLGFLTVLFSRAMAVDRLFENSLREDGREDFVMVSADLFWKYFPWGSGSGSFVEIYKFYEPPHLLDPSYLNHAHNDWVENAVTYGAPSLALFAISIILYIKLTYRLWRYGEPSRRAVLLARMASVVIGMIALASFSDYPLRTPIMMAVMALLILWFVNGDMQLGKQTQSSAINHFQEERDNSSPPLRDLTKSGA